MPNDNLPELAERSFTPEEQLDFLSDRASFQPGREDLKRKSGRKWSVPGLEVEVHYSEDEAVDDLTTVVRTPEYEAITTLGAAPRLMEVANGSRQPVSPENYYQAMGHVITTLRSNLEQQAA